MVVTVLSATPSREDFKSKPLRKRGEARVGAILEAATHVFLERGFEKATMTEIVTRSGGSKSLIYEQFGGKTGLFRAMMEQRCAGMMAPLDQIVQSSGSPRETLTGFAHGFVAALSHPEVVGLQRVAVAEGNRNPDVAKSYFAYGHDVAYDRLTDYLAGVNMGGADKTTLRRLAVMFFAMIQGDSIERLVVGATDSLDADVERYIDIAVGWLLGQIEAD